MTDGDFQAHFRAARHRVVKWAHFLAIYEQLLSPYRGRAVTLVEVGVGAGGSLETWRSYLGPSARIIGIDLDPARKMLESDGFEIIIGDQADPGFWARHLPAIGPIDVLIDDGGHTCEQQIVTIACSLPHVRDGGLIVVEDTHTSYMPKDYPAPARFGFMQFAQHVVDVLHARNHLVRKLPADATGLGRAIHSVGFHESLVVFHVDRRLCGPSEMVRAGSGAWPLPAATLRSRIGEALESQPGWIRWLVDFPRGALRASKRIAYSYRVRRYFR